jgi:hypothetical protein
MENFQITSLFSPNHWRQDEGDFDDGECLPQQQEGSFSMATARWRRQLLCTDGDVYDTGSLEMGRPAAGPISQVALLEKYYYY